MKRIFSQTKKINNLFLLGNTLLLVIFTVLTLSSCKFTANQKPAAEDTVLVSFTSVLPPEYTSSQTEKTNSRSAIPEFTDDSLLYDITASYTDTDASVKTIRRNGSERDFTLPLIPGKIYTVSVIAYDSSDSTKSPIFTGTRNNIIVNINAAGQITNENGPYSISLRLGNIQTGNGSIRLKYKPNYEPKNQTLTCSYSITGNEQTINSTPRIITSGQVYEISVTSIPASTTPYDLLVTFKRGSEIVYQFHTDVMVFANTETNTFKNEIELGTGEDSNTIVITQNLVDAYSSKYCYVKYDASSTPSDNGQGTYDSPWKNLQSAVDKIVDQNNGDSRYTIYILSDLSGNYQLNNNGTETDYYPGKLSLSIPATNTTNLNLLIQGIGSSIIQLDSDSSDPEISLTNNSTASVSLELKKIACEHGIETTNADVTISNAESGEITITNGYAELTNVTSGDIEITGEATFTDVTTSGNITVTNGDVIFDGVNEGVSSSSTVITTTGGSAQFTTVNASSISATVSTGNATLSGVSSNTVTITIQDINTNGTATLNNVKATSSIEITGGDATLTNINTNVTPCSTSIQVSGGDAHLITVRSGDITVTGNATLDHVTSSGDIEITGEASLTYVTTSGDITVDGKATLDNVQADAITVSNGNASFTDVTATGDIEVTDGNATFIDVIASGNITVSNGNVIFDGVNEDVSSSSTVITTTGGSAQFATVNASSISATVSNGNAALSETNSTSVTITIQDSNTNGTATLENVKATSSIEITGGDATLTNINTNVTPCSTSIQVSGGDAHLTTVRSGDITVTGDAILEHVTSSGDITVGGGATLDNVQADAITVSNGNGSFTDVTASGDITVSNGDAVFIGVNEGASSSSIAITTAGGSAQFTTVTADSISATVSNGNATLSGVNSATVSITIPSTNSNGKASLNTVQAATSIEVSGGAARLYNVTSPDIDFTDVDITLIGVTSSPAPATGYNITLDEDCTIKIGGKTGLTNTIGSINLPKNASNQQIVFQILNVDVDSNNSPLTLNGSSITFTTETEPTAANQYIPFTSGFSAATNTSELVSEIFTNANSFVTGQIETSTSTYEGCIAISSGSVTINYLDNITFLVNKTEVESKALNSVETGSSFEIPSGYTGSPRTITVSAQKDGDSVNMNNISSLSVKLISTQVSGSSSVIATSSTNTITVPYGLPEGQYILRVVGFYNNGVTSAGYSSDFTITITDNVQFAASKTMLLKGGSTEEKTLSIFGSYLTNNLTIGVLDATTSPFAITSNTGSASVVLSADSPTCGSYTVNIYGYCTVSGEQVYFRDSIPITVGEFVVEFKKNTTVANSTISMGASDTGDNRKIKINAKLRVSTSTSEDVNLNSTAEVHVVRITGSGATATEEELYIHDDIAISSTEIVYTVPANLSAGNYRIDVILEHDGITKTITQDLTLTN